MKKLKISISIVLLSSSLSYGQSWNWGKSGYGTMEPNNYGTPVATDRNGNAYVVGQYKNSVNFDSIILTTATNGNSFLVKYNSSGTVLWSTQPSDSGGVASGSDPSSISTDKSGNIFITGVFWGSIKFGSITLRCSSNGTDNAFLVKYDGNGNVLWAKQSQDESKVFNSFGNVATSVATDNMGNCLITGSFPDTVSFGTYTLYGNYQPQNIFLVKYDSIGNVLWAKQSTKGAMESWPIDRSSVTTDNSGNSYVTGFFNDTLVFDTYTLSSPNYQYSAFLVKYSPTGNVLWAKQSENDSLSSNAHATSITMDNIGNSYIAGYFGNSVKFGSNTIYSHALYNAFLTKYDPNGNVLWVKQSSPEWVATGLSSDTFNHIYLSGLSYSPKIDSLRFDSYKLYTDPWVTYASFLLEFDASGNPLCGSIINNLGVNYYTNGVASDSTGNFIYIAGTFWDTIICAKDTLIEKDGGANFFLGRWQSCNPTSISPIIPSTGFISIFPNPSSGTFTLSLSNVTEKCTIEIYNVLGERVESEKVKGESEELDLRNQPNGVYFYRVIQVDGGLVGSGKMIIEK